MKLNWIFALIVALVPLASACQIFGDSEPDPIWVEREFSSASENVVWQVVLQGLEKFRFPRSVGIDPDNLIAQTGWRRTLAPFRGKGSRSRARVEITPLEGDRYFVRLRIQKQLNMAIVNQVDPRYAEWEWTEDDQIESQVLMRHFRTYLDATPGFGE